MSFGYFWMVLCWRFVIYWSMCENCLMDVSFFSCSRLLSIIGCCGKMVSWWVVWMCLLIRWELSLGVCIISLIFCVFWWYLRLGGCCWCSIEIFCMCFMLFVMILCINCILSGWICMKGVGLLFLVFMGKMIGILVDDVF